MGLTGLIRRMPRGQAMRFGARVGGVAYRVARKPRRYAECNLRLAYGDALTAAERDALVRGVFSQFSKSIIDFLRAPTVDRAQMDALVPTVEGAEWLEAVRAPKRGFLIVTGHIGNFELLGRWLALHGIPSTVAARDPRDPALARYLRRMREGVGNTVLSKGASAREMLVRLKRGEVITLGIDQNSGDVFVPFFGVPAGTVAGPASLALHTGAPLLPCYCVRDPDDTYRIIFLPPISAQATGDREADVTRVMAAANAALESVVRRFPDQWLWLHNRWKSAFEEKNRDRLPPGFDIETARARWNAPEKETRR